MKFTTCQIFVIVLILCLSFHVSAALPIVKCGVDNLVDTQFELLKGKRVVLVSHAAARCYTGRNTAEEFATSDVLQLIRILSPEHGFFGVASAGETVGNSTLYGVEVHSLYGAKRKPGKVELQDADVVVIDLQDIGVRSYTYISTMTEVLVSCAELNIPVMILDRPNPFGGEIVDGNVPDPSIRSFIARLPTPYLHGMTMGELALMANGEHWLGKNSNNEYLKCDVTVVKCKRWLREMQWENTGLPWYPTSPNIPSVNSVRGYAVTGVMGELGLISIGIGTTSPFTIIGAPEFSLDTVDIAKLRSVGVQLFAAQFVPPSGKYSKQFCSGYHLAFVADSLFRPYLAAMLLIHSVASKVPISPSIAKSNSGQMFVKASGNAQYLQCVINRSQWKCYSDLITQGVESFKTKRIQYLLY
ncbi:MAG: DUF1343 domain-containing protein [Ignavibacteria bacterium]|nr:DUF1343 domain-containing protein [Ignavibacteria bacterium]